MITFRLTFPSVFSYNTDYLEQGELEQGEKKMKRLFALAVALSFVPASYAVDAVWSNSATSVQEWQTVGNWQDAEQQLSKAIHLKPKLVSNYVNRALVRLNVNNLRGAMADYDMAIDLDPNNFLAHYNRGLLRVQVGDDNRAIEDFNYVLRMEPGNLMATYNRATLHHRTGNLRAAIVDYTKVIEQYPNFWTGLHNRADCYRRLGMHRQAELDEFRILKAQMDKHVGIQPRWTKNQRKQTRKKSEIDFSKYNQIVVEDEEVVEREYESAYRGRIQNRKIDVEYMPMYEVSYLKYANVVSMNQVFDKEVEAFNRVARPSHELKVTCNPHTLNEEQSAIYLNLIDTLSRRIDSERDMQTVKRLLLQLSCKSTARRSWHIGNGRCVWRWRASLVLPRGWIQKSRWHACWTI